MFCRSDHQSVCPLCYPDQHKGHDVTLTESERARIHKELDKRTEHAARMRHLKGQDLDKLKLALTDLRASAEMAIRQSNDTFTELISLMEKRKSEVEKETRDELRASQSGLRVHLDEAKQELAGVQKQITDWETLRDQIQVTHHVTHHAVQLLPLRQVEHASEPHPTQHVHRKPGPLQTEHREQIVVPSIRE